MLSRDADSLYWMSRYLERAEHTARLLAVGLNLMLDQTTDSAGARWGRLLSALHASLPSGASDPYTITRELTFEQDNAKAIVSCVARARENARQVRQEISSEMWEQLNRLYLRVQATTPEQIWQGEPIEFYQAIKEGAHLFQGITDATMTHGEGWRYIELGRYLERASGTAALLDVHYRDFSGGRDQPTHVGEYVEWVALLRSCSAFEAYCRHYTADLRSIRIAEFLILNADFPRSIRFSAGRIQSALKAIATLTGRGGRAERLAGRLLASLDYGQVDEIVGDQLGPYLEGIVRQTNQINVAVNQQYVQYPIDAALSA
jgi:uncharacterized alpha-E superfamily protein